MWQQEKECSRHQIFCEPDCEAGNKGRCIPGAAATREYIGSQENTTNGGIHEVKHTKIMRTSSQIMANMRTDATAEITTAFLVRLARFSGISHPSLKNTVYLHQGSSSFRN
jgi:hypothetical protein